MKDDYSDENPELGALYPEHLDTVLARHDDALDKAGAAHVVVFSGAPKVAFLDDQAYPFRANPHLVGWAPFYNVPLSYIVYTPGETPRLIYMQPKDFWHTTPAAPDGYWSSSFDVRIVHTIEEVAAHLPENRDKCVAIGEFDDAAHAFGIDRVNPTSLLNMLHYARGRKTSYELACLRLASRRGARGHLAAESAFRNGRSEFEIHLAYCEAVGLTDPELPYDNIIAVNEHAAVLHYTARDRRPPRLLRSFLIDAGAQVHGYASDITRTYAATDTRFESLIQRMEALQIDVISRVTAGVDFRELHLETHRLLAGVLRDTGLATGDADTLIESGVTSAFLPHGLGHLLGLQVHDVGGHMESAAGGTIDPPSGHPFLRLTRGLEEDMVLTIEPGLYVIDMLLEDLRETPARSHVNWEAVDWLRPFGGIRIEDNVRVLEDGVENLTRDAFAAL